MLTLLAAPALAFAPPLPLRVDPLALMPPSVPALLFLALAIFGLAYCVGHARVSLAPREWLARRPLGRWLVELLECPACFGFWAGLAAGAWQPDLVRSLFPCSMPMPVAALALGFFTCAVGYLLGRATGWLTEDTQEPPHA